MKTLPFLLAGCLAMGQEAARPPVAVVLVPQAPAREGVKVDLANFRADLTTLLRENGLQESEAPAPGAATLTVHPETFLLPEGVRAFSALAFLETPGRPGAMRGRIVVALRGGQDLALELRQAVADVAAALLRAEASRGQGFRALALTVEPPAPRLPELPFGSLKVRIRPQDPPYPGLARQRGIQGKVEARVTVGADGRPTRAELVSGPEELALAGLYQAMRWYFEPVQGAAGPVEARTQMKIAFSLSSGLGSPALPVQDQPTNLDIYNGRYRHEREEMPK